MTADAHKRGFSRGNTSLQVEQSQAGIAALRNILFLGYYRNLVHPLFGGQQRIQNQLFPPTEGNGQKTKTMTIFSHRGE